MHLEELHMGSILSAVHKSRGFGMSLTSAPTHTRSQCLASLCVYTCSALLELLAGLQLFDNVHGTTCCPCWVSTATKIQLTGVDKFTGLERFSSDGCMKGPRGSIFNSMLRYILLINRLELLFMRFNPISYLTVVTN